MNLKSAFLSEHDKAVTVLEVEWHVRGSLQRGYMTNSLCRSHEQENTYDRAHEQLNQTVVQVGVLINMFNRTLTRGQRQLQKAVKGVMSAGSSWGCWKTQGSWAGVWEIFLDQILCVYIDSWSDMSSVEFSYTFSVTLYLVKLWFTKSLLIFSQWK